LGPCSVSEVSAVAISEPWPRAPSQRWPAPGSAVLFTVRPIERQHSKETVNLGKNLSISRMSSSPYRACNFGCLVKALPLRINLRARPAEQLPRVALRDSDLPGKPDSIHRSNRLARPCCFRAPGKRRPRGAGQTLSARFDPIFPGLALSPCGRRNGLEQSLASAFEPALVVRFCPMEENPCLTTADVTS